MLACVGLQFDLIPTVTDYALDMPSDAQSCLAMSSQLYQDSALFALDVCSLSHFEHKSNTFNLHRSFIPVAHFI